MANIVDSLMDFALPKQRLFPCDTASLVKASSDAFEKQAHLLSAEEKISAAKFITKSASQLSVDIHGSKASRITDSEMNPLFKIALRHRKEACAWHPDALKQIRSFEVLGDLINKQENTVRSGLMTKFAEQLESFDRKWDTYSNWSDIGIPDAVDTIFLKEDAGERGDVIKVGSRQINKKDFERFDKTAAEKSLSPGVLALANFEGLAMADDVTRAAIVAFIR